MGRPRGRQLRMLPSVDGTGVTPNARHIMQKLLRAAAVAAFLTLGAASVAQAQTAERTYDLGPVWNIAYIQTKPGMFDDYMAYVKNTWIPIQEAEKAAGYVLDYNVLSVDNPRDGEADVILITKYKDSSIFDRPLAQGDAVMARAFGSVKQSNVAAVKREDVRTLRGSMNAREMTFGK